jgi:hypothetical protein
VAVNGGKEGELAVRFFREITGIQYGEIEDRHRWIHKVE